jgi:predicted ATP-grasp superfamily ATP-dependent carboligase
VKPVLVLSGHVAALAVARSLGPAGIPVFVASYDRRDMAPCSRHVRGTCRVPHPEADEEAFLTTLEAFGRAHDRPLLMPADDGSLVVTSRNRERLARSFLVACPELPVVERLIDKRQTYAAAAGFGVAVPSTMAPQTARECADAAEAVGYPCLVKPATSHRYFELLGVKYRRVASRSEAEGAFLEAKSLGTGVMVQEWVPGGDEYGVNYNAYATAGQVRVEFTARKVRMAPSGGGVPSAVVSERVLAVLEPGRRTLAALGYTGFACCEFKWDGRAGVFKLLEVNGRHNRSGLLATRCGINFPLIEYHNLVNGRRPEGLAFTSGRYWIDEFKDLTHFPQRARLGLMNGVTFWRPYIRPPVCAVLDWTDPFPFLHRFGVGFRVLGRRLRHAAPAGSSSGHTSTVPERNP